MGPSWNSAARVQIAHQWGVVGAEAQGLVCALAVASPPHRIRGQGLHAWKGSGNEECAAREFSVQATSPSSRPPPTPSTVPAGGHLSLSSADAI